MYLLMWALAFVTHLPRYRDLSPSRNSTASCSPVDAPDGTAARPMLPSARNTSASTVGLPRESKISLPMMPAIFVIGSLQRFLTENHECTNACETLYARDGTTTIPDSVTV